MFAHITSNDGLPVHSASEVGSSWYKFGSTACHITGFDACRNRYSLPDRGRGETRAEDQIVWTVLLWSIYRQCTPAPCTMPPSRSAKHTTVSACPVGLHLSTFRAGVLSQSARTKCKVYAGERWFDFSRPRTRPEKGEKFEV